MKVYIVSEYQYIDYEGGGAENLGVYGSYEAAYEGLVECRAQYHSAGDLKKTPLPKPEWNEEAKMWEFAMPCEGGDWSYRIELWTVK